MKLKKSKISSGFLIKGISLACVSFFSTPLIVSCSSLESQLNSLLSNTNIINLEVNIDGIKSTTGKEEVSISDLFTADVKPLNVVNSQELDNWNNGLSENDKNSFVVNPKIIGVVLPEISQSETTIEELTVYVDISAAHLQNKIIEKKVKLSNVQGFNNQIVLGTNNYFDWTSVDPTKTEGPLSNDLYRTIQSNVLRILASKGISSSDSQESLSSKLNFTFDIMSDSNNNHIYQKNLHCIYESSNSDTLYVSVYTSNQRLNDFDEVKSRNVALRLSYKFLDLVNGNGNN